MRMSASGLGGALCCLGVCALLLSLPSPRAAAEGRGELICGYTAPIGEGFAGVAAHTHTADCYNAAGELVCPLPELAAHVHTDACYTEQRRLICPLEETAGHQHGEGCYAAQRGELLCTEESEEHEHSEGCYAWTQALVCGLSEGEGAHSHDESCHETTRTLSCGQLGLHVHTDACRGSGGALICGLPQFEEHIHTDACFAAPTEEAETETEEPPEAEAEATAPEEAAEPEETEAPLQSDPTADRESKWDWDAFFQNLDRSGPWDETLLNVARSQLGYTESTRNFGWDSEGQFGGYTRYGDWYGRPYSPWCAMFISYCLYYAEIPEEAMPRESGVRRWISELEARGLYAEAAGCMPEAGDLIFFDFDRDGKGDHVGLVEKVYEKRADAWRLETIEGNRTPAVERFCYRLEDKTILGYGLLPDKPGTAVGETVEVTEAPADDEAFQPAREAPEQPAFPDARQRMDAALATVRAALAAAGN